MLLTVAIALSEDVHGEVVFAVPEPVNCVVLFIQIEFEPVIVGDVIVMVLVVVQPLVVVKVTMAVPLEIPVTNPILLTVATEVFEELQGEVVFGVPVPVN